MTIVEKLTAVKRTVGSLAPDQENKEGGRKFKYRSVDGVVNAVAQALIDEGVVIHSTSAELLASEQVTYGAKGTLAFRTTIAVEYEWTDGESSITSQVVAESIDSGDKGTAKAMSVAYRIAILQTLTLPTGDPDPDSMSTGEGPSSIRTHLVDTLGGSGFPLFMQKELIELEVGRTVHRVEDLTESEALRVQRVIEGAMADRDQLEQDR